MAIPCMNVQNEFTKEDLQEIKRCVVYMTKGGTTPYSLFTLEVKKKIQSMIDNYCEHDFHHCLSPLNIETCHKCMRVK